MSSLPPLRAILTWHLLFVVLAVLAMTLYYQSFNPMDFQTTDLNLRSNAIQGVELIVEGGRTALSKIALVVHWKQNFSDRFN